MGVGVTTDQLRTTTAELSALQRSAMDTSDKWFALDTRRGPIWGSRGREFKSRQPDQHYPLSEGSSRPITTSPLAVHTIMCEHCVSNPWANQRGGTIHGLLPDGSNQVRINVSRDGNRRMPEQLGHGADIGTPREH
jgi:hypothetical protein